MLEQVKAESRRNERVRAEKQVHQSSVLMMVSITEQEGVGDEHLQNFKIYLSRVSKEACVRAESSSSRENVL